MAIAETLLPEFDQEMEHTRKRLERVPDDKFGWKPHLKSMRMGNLAVHLAQIPAWGVAIVERDSLGVIHRERMPVNPSAARSLEEGLEETLTGAQETSGILDALDRFPFPRLSLAL
jgi:hypothetical protein